MGGVPALLVEYDDVVVLKEEHLLNQVFGPLSGYLQLNILWAVELGADLVVLEVVESVSLSQSVLGVLDDGLVGIIDKEALVSEHLVDDGPGHSHPLQILVESLPGIDLRYRNALEVFNVGKGLASVSREFQHYGTQTVVNIFHNLGCILWRVAKMLPTLRAPRLTQSGLLELCPVFSPLNRTELTSLA